jgi:small subunit ribosomal protein S1
VKKGDTVDVVILNIDAENKRISLGLKQASEDPWLRIGETYPVGTELRGRVVRLMEKGVVVDIGNDIEGFVPLSHLPADKAISSPADVCWEGMNLDLRVVEVDPIHRRIVLTVTAIPEEQPPKLRRRQDPHRGRRRRRRGGILGTAHDGSITAATGPGVRADRRRPSAPERVAQ